MNIMQKNRSMTIGIISLLLLTLFITSSVLASGPKSVYGTLYIGGQIAPAGVDVKIKIENQTFTKKTFAWGSYNYIIGLSPGNEGKTAYFFIGDSNIVPTDNISFNITSSIEYIFNIHIGHLIQNTPPRAIIDSISPNPTAYNQTIRFVGHGVDSDGNITAYHWRSSISENLSDNHSFNLTSLQRGNHTIYFKVQDNNNTWSSEVSQVLQITYYNHPPKATIDSVIPQRVRVNTNISFKGHGNDTDGTMVGYSWRSNRSGILSNQASFITSTLSKGNHTIFFKVMDNTSYWSPEVQTWVLVLDNVPPIARISAPTQTEIGVPIQFNGTGSYDPDGIIKTWFWEFGDTTNSSSAQPTHIFNETKTYTIKLTVTDDSGAQANTTTQISITQAQPPITPNRNPETPTITGPTKGLVDTKYQFSFIASDPDNDNVYFMIDWGDGKNNATQFTASNEPITIAHSWMKAGIYTVNATTWDLNYGSSEKQTHQIIISDSLLGGFSSLFGGINWYIPVVVLVIICIAIILTVLLIRKRKSIPQNLKFFENTNDEIPDNTPYPDQSVEIPSNQPPERSSGFKRI